MTTVKEFYEQFDSVEMSLIEMSCSPVGNLAVLAQKGLRWLYTIKRDLVTVFLSPNEDTPIELICPAYRYIKRFVEEHYGSSSEKSMILRDKGSNLRFSGDREKDLSFFIERGHVTR